MLPFHRITPDRTLSDAAMLEQVNAHPVITQALTNGTTIHTAWRATCVVGRHAVMMAIALRQRGFEDVKVKSFGYDGGPCTDRDCLLGTQDHIHVYFGQDELVTPELLSLVRVLVPADYRDFILAVHKTPEELADEVVDGIFSGLLKDLNQGQKAELQALKAELS